MPKLQPVALSLAVATAVLAGATDVAGLARLHDVFVSFMSGNTTLLGQALGEGDMARARLIGGVIALFVAGAAAGAILAERAGRYHALAVMAAVAVLLALPLASDALAVPTLVLAMGALNTTMDRIGDTGVGLTYVTGALVKLGVGAGRWLAGRRAGHGWLLHAPIWASLLVGAVGGTVLRARLGPQALWPLPLLATVLLPLCLVHGRLAQARAPAI